MKHIRKEVLEKLTLTVKCKVTSANRGNCKRYNEYMTKHLAVNHCRGKRDLNQENSTERCTEYNKRTCDQRRNVGENSTKKNNFT